MGKKRKKRRKSTADKLKIAALTLAIIRELVGILKEIIKQ